MIYVILASVITVAILVFIIHNNHKTIKDLRQQCAIHTFNNVQPRRMYNEILVFLTSKKSKFSLESKVELISMWTSLCMYLPINYIEIVNGVKKSVNIDGTTITPAEHKKAMIEELRKLSDSEEFLEDSFTKALYHLYYIILL
jgi:hypothetical protein